MKTFLSANPTTEISLDNNCYKLRLRISAKKTGKSRGARVVTYFKIEKKLITLPNVYDKTEEESITEKELTALIKKAG